MLVSNFNGIKLEFDGLYYGGNYEIEVFGDGRFYYSYIENTSVELKKGSFQINQKEIMIFEEMMEYFELLKNQRNYMINEFNFGNGVLVIQKDNGREEKIRLGKEMMFEYAKTLIDKYAKKSRRLFLLDLFREFNGISLNAVAVYNSRKEKVGYLPKSQSEIIARMIDAGKKFVAVPIPFDEETALKVYLVD